MRAKAIIGDKRELSEVTKSRIETSRIKICTGDIKEKESHGK